MVMSCPQKLVTFSLNISLCLLEGTKTLIENEGVRRKHSLIFQRPQFKSYGYIVYSQKNSPRISGRQCENLETRFQNVKIEPEYMNQRYFKLKESVKVA
jgi:hypothetical protein